MEKAAFPCKKVFEKWNARLCGWFAKVPKLCGVWAQKCRAVLSKNVKVKKIEYISNHVYKNVAIYQNVFKQRWYITSFCKNSRSSDVTAVYCCLFVRQRFVKYASFDRGTLSMVLLSRRLLLNACVTNRKCFALSADDSRNRFATSPARWKFGTAGFAERSNPHAVAFEQCLAAKRIVQLGKLKFRSCDCCEI